MSTEKTYQEEITELHTDLKKYRIMNNNKNLEIQLLKEDIGLYRNAIADTDTLKSLITKQDLILREYKDTIDKIRLACPKWQIAELEEILSPRQNGFDLND